MSRDPAGASSRMRSWTSRRGWLWGGLVLILFLATLLRPRPIRIPLSDGTTLTISAVTTGLKHSRPEPFRWTTIRNQIARGQWTWPRQVHSVDEPSTILWLDDPEGLDQRSLVLVDRHGWRWSPILCSPGSEHSTASFFPIETDGTARLDVMREALNLGTVTLPLQSPVPFASPRPAWGWPDVTATPGEPSPFPIHRIEGSLIATLHAVDVQVVEGPISRSEGRIRLETSSNGEPFEAGVGFAMITDEFGRWDGFPERSFTPEGRFQSRLSPYGTAWTLYLQIFRERGVPLDPKNTFLVTPTPLKAASHLVDEGSFQGQAWRVSLVPPGETTILRWFDQVYPPRQEDSPVLVVEVATGRLSRVRIEPLDAGGRPLKATTMEVDDSPYLHVVRCPEFDAAKGYTIRIGFDVGEVVPFVFRPTIVPAGLD